MVREQALKYVGVLAPSWVYEGPPLDRADRVRRCRWSKSDGGISSERGSPADRFQINRTDALQFSSLHEFLGV